MLKLKDTLKNRCNNNSRTKNSILNISFGIVGRILSIALNFAVRTVFIYTLGKEYLGINGLFSSILTMLSLTELGFGTAINYKLYKPLAENDEKRVRMLMKFYKQAYRVVGLAILSLGICLIPTLPFLIKDYGSLQALGINATLIFLLHILRSTSSYLFFAYRSAVMRANQQQYILDLIGYVVTILTNITKIIVLVFWGDFVIYTATVIVFNVIQNLVNAIIAKWYYPQFFEKENENLSKKEIWELLKDCGALFVYKVNFVITKSVGNTVISAFIGLTSVALYSNYYLFYTTINGLFDKVYSAVKASAGNLFATETLEKQYSFFQVMNFLSAILFGTAGAAVAVCADELITAWIGSSYVIKQPFAILVGLEILSHGLRMNLAQVRNLTGAFRQMWFRPIIGVLINVGISVWLVHIYGIYSIFIGMLTADILTTFLVDPRIIHTYSFNNYRPVSEYYMKNLLYVGLLFAVCALDIWLSGLIIVNRSWLSVVFHGLLVVITVPSLFLFLFWKTNECQYLVNIAGGILKKKIKFN